VEKPLLIADVIGDEIIVRTLGFFAAYTKPSNAPQLILRHRTETDNHELLIVIGDEIVVTSDTGFRAAYCRRPHHPQLIVKRRTDTNDHELIAQAWQAANDKARELGWIV
jgi:hypothetical protein